ncbi:MAG: cytochrome B, partial [Rhodocyclales bacterium]|nr:cytochrome B [Rhodocyclales bacterium]
MIALVILHVGAVAFYVKVKKDNLTIPMITGWKDVAEPVDAPRGGGLAAFLLAAIIAAAAACAASGALLPPPPQPAAVETPAF